MTPRETAAVRRIVKQVKALHEACDDMIATPLIAEADAALTKLLDYALRNTLELRRPK